MLSLSLLVALVPTARGEAYETGNTLPSLAVPRSGAGVAIGADGLIYICGGWANFTSLVTADTTLIYDPVTGTTQYGHNMQVGVGGASCAVGPDGRIYMFGGYNSSVGNYYRGVQIYNITSDSWTSSTSMPRDYYMSAAATGTDGKIYIFGGNVSGGTVNSTLIYDPVAGTWSYGRDMPNWVWAPSAVTVSSTAIMVAGGGNYSGTVDTVQIYNPVTNTWSMASPMNEAKMALSLVMGRNGYVYALGGDSDWSFPATATSLGTIERYDVATDTWTTSSYSLDYARCFAGAVTDADGHIILVGGYAGTTTLSYVEFVLPMDITGIGHVEITSPTDGSVVSGDVAVQVATTNYGYYMSVDFLVDGTLVETQLGGTQWTFMWNTSGLADGSTHILMVRAYAYDLSVVEASVTVTVSAQSVAEQLAAIQSQLASLQAQLNIPGANLTALAMQVAILQAKLDGIIAGSAATTASMNATFASLQSQLDSFQTQIDRVEKKADTAGTYSIVNLVLVVVVLVLLALMLMMLRKKP